MHASLREGGVSHRVVRAPQNYTPICAVRLWGCTLPLEGAGRVLGFAGRLMARCRPVELYPRGQLFLTAVFQDFSGLEIDLHRGGLSCARRALLRFSKTSTVFFQGVFLRAVCCSGAPAGACAPP